MYACRLADAMPLSSATADLNDDTASVPTDRLIFACRAAAICDDFLTVTLRSAATNLSQALGLVGFQDRVDTAISREMPMRERALHRPLLVFSLLRRAGGIFLCVSITTTAVVARDIAPLTAAPSNNPATAVADWRIQMVGRIERAKTFPASGYCREGLVKVSFRIDRQGNLLASEVAESSNVPVFDAEALAMLKRAHPFPPPPEGVAGASVSLSVPIRFRPTSQGTGGEKLVYLNLKSDLTLTLDGVPVESKGLDRAISAATSSDKNARIMICSDENVPPEQLSNLAEQVKGAGFKFAVPPRPGPNPD
jgi:TonB family protein